MIYAGWMFQCCTNLIYIDLSSWNSSKLDITGIFASCEKLNVIDMRNLTFNTITMDDYYTFFVVPVSATIIVKDETQREALKSKNAFPGTIKISQEI